MTDSTPIKDPFFTAFGDLENTGPLPDRFILFGGNEPHPLCLLAAEKVQLYLKTQTEWKHNFGLNEVEEGPVIGKMFGVLVVKTEHNELGYLAAFSGKLAGGNHHSRFVPPVFDGLTDNSFLNVGMRELTRMNLEIKEMEDSESPESEMTISLLKTTRKTHSSALQQEIFNNIQFLNQAGKEKSLTDIFKAASYKNPPSGAGECAGPKLLQYAFQHKMKPVALVEFWWGLSPKSDLWKHGHFYPCCHEKCGPILAHMLEGLDQELG